MAKQAMQGKVVLITGSSSGIGAATARAFAAEGAKLFLCARRLDLLEMMRKELKALGASDIRCESLDVTDQRAVEELLNETGGTAAEWSGIDVLVNNAGLSRGLGKLYEDDVANWDEMIATNVRGLLYVRGPWCRVWSSVGRVTWSVWVPPRATRHTRVAPSTAPARLRSESSVKV